jgi:hypothetical protein
VCGSVVSDAELGSVVALDEESGGVAVVVVEGLDPVVVGATGGVSAPVVVGGVDVTLVVVGVAVGGVAGWVPSVGGNAGGTLEVVGAVMVGSAELLATADDFGASEPQPVSRSEINGVATCQQLLLDNCKVRALIWTPRLCFRCEPYLAPRRLPALA